MTRTGLRRFQSSSATEKTTCVAQTVSCRHSGVVYLPALHVVAVVKLIVVFRDLMLFDRCFDLYKFQVFYVARYSIWSTFCGCDDPETLCCALSAG